MEIDLCLGLLILLVIVSIPIAIYKWAQHYSSPSAVAERQAKRDKQEQKARDLEAKRQWEAWHKANPQKTKMDLVNELEATLKEDLAIVEKIADPDMQEAANEYAMVKHAEKLKNLLN